MKEAMSIETERMDDIPLLLTHMQRIRLAENKEGYLSQILTALYDLTAEKVQKHIHHTIKSTIESVAASEIVIE